MSRTRRCPYTRSKAVDSTCRSHGSCPWCAGKRKHKGKRRQPADVAAQLKAADAVAEEVLMMREEEG